MSKAGENDERLDYGLSQDNDYFSQDNAIFQDVNVFEDYPLRAFDGPAPTVLNWDSYIIPTPAYHTELQFKLQLMTNGFVNNAMGTFTSPNEIVTFEKGKLAWNFWSPNPSRGIELQMFFNAARDNPSVDIRTNHHLDVKLLGPTPRLVEIIDFDLTGAFYGHFGIDPGDYWKLYFNLKLDGSWSPDASQMSYKLRWRVGVKDDDMTELNEISSS